MWKNLDSNFKIRWLCAPVYPLITYLTIQYCMYCRGRVTTFRVEFQVVSYSASSTNEYHLPTCIHWKWRRAVGLYITSALSVPDGTYRGSFSSIKIQFWFIFSPWIISDRSILWPISENENPQVFIFREFPTEKTAKKGSFELLKTQKLRTWRFFIFGNRLVRISSEFLDQN